MLLVAITALHLGLASNLAAPPCPSTNSVLQTEICNDPEFSAADRALTTLGVRLNQARTEKCEDRRCVREEYDAAINGALRRNRSALVFKRVSPAGELRLLHTEPGWLMVYVDFVNYTKPPNGEAAYYAKEDTLAGMAHLVNGQAEVDMGGFTLKLTPHASALWDLKVSSDCLWEPDLTPAGVYRAR